MKQERIAALHTAFEACVHQDDGNTEYWLARELQELLDYTEWRNFVVVIDRAREACKNAGQRVVDHFVEVNKMVDLGSGSQREIADIMLTRYACYLIAQNGDPRKDPIAFAQTYFAMQTRKQELIARRIAEQERLAARKKLSESEKELSSVIYDRLQDEHGVARVRSKGDEALFGGHTTAMMKDRLGVPAKRPLADFLPTITLKAKDFANEITNFNVKRDELLSEPAITREHVNNNKSVRQVLVKRGITPEDLPAAEDAKKIERRSESETRKLVAGQELSEDSRSTK
ncbi:MAG: DNA damage-inducible protein D [bacterium]